VTIGVETGTLHTSAAVYLVVYSSKAKCLIHTKMMRHITSYNFNWLSVSALWFRHFFCAFEFYDTQRGGGPKIL